MKITQTDTPTIWMDYHPIETNWWTGAPISAIPPLLHRMPFLAQPSQFILACIPGTLVICLVAWWHSSQQLYKIFKAQALLHCNHYLHTHAHAHAHAHTHTHTTILPLYRFCPGQPGWAATSRNIHPLTPIVVINRPLSASSIYSQSLSKFSLVYLLAGIA